MMMVKMHKPKFMVTLLVFNLFVSIYLFISVLMGGMKNHKINLNPQIS